MDALSNLSLNRFDHKWDRTAEQLSAPGCFRSASIRPAAPAFGSGSNSSILVHPSCSRDSSYSIAAPHSQHNKSSLSRNVSSSQAESSAPCPSFRPGKAELRTLKPEFKQESPSESTVLCRVAHYPAPAAAGDWGAGLMVVLVPSHPIEAVGATPAGAAKTNAVFSREETGDSSASRRPRRHPRA
jgi:hypothetical protein